MKHDELDHLLKSVQPPGRPGAYWDAFPQKVAARLREPERAADHSHRAPGAQFGFRLAWGLGLAAACVICGYVIGFRRGHSSLVSDAQLAQAWKYYREIEGLFPHQIRAIVFEHDGPRLILAEQADVPASPPFYVKVCGSDGCRGFVTFSGQQIPVNGENCEVLADARDRVVLIGRDHVWSESDSSGPVRVTAKTLGSAL